MIARKWAWSLPFLMILNTSAAYAQTHPPGAIRDVEYAQVNGISLRLDACLPDSPVKTPAVIIVHGGGWVRGDRRFDVEPLFEPLSQAGLAWFSIDYRLATDVTQFGVAIDDVQSAIRYVKAHADEYNIDPNRIALIGESAGGQLAAMAVLRGGADVSVKAVVAIYTPTDLVSLVKNSRYVPAQMQNAIKGSPWESFILAGLSQLSPIENIRRGMPPFLFIHGTSDMLVPFEQSKQMCERMRKAGASCEIYLVEGAGHGIRWWDSNRASRLFNKIMVPWLEKQL
ncbi:MAG: alpha/beta hydrolase [Acidobacteriaceae bacterium]|nr:alpha/beta hydrolase [Acidobacteriaceae bacterium]